jgi:hypothetical protein
MNAQRLFVAIDLPDILAESMVALDPHYRGLIFSAPSQIHLTLAFFAAVDPATADLLEEKLAAISFRAFFFAGDRTWHLLKKRYAARPLDRRWSRPPASLSIAQAGQ